MIPSEWRNKWGWKKDPFRIQVEGQPIIPTGTYEYIAGEVDDGVKLMLYSDGVGEGKSTLAYEIRKKGLTIGGEKADIIYERQDVTSDIIDERLKKNLGPIKRFFVKDHKLIDAYRNHRPTVIVLDEAQDYIGKPENERLNRRIRDISNVDCRMSVIVLGTPAVNDIFQLGSVRDRKVDIKPIHMDDEQLMEMIRLRIAEAGGSDFTPFGKANIERIITKLKENSSEDHVTPREILMVIGDLIRFLAEKEFMETVDEGILEDFFKQELEQFKGLKEPEKKVVRNGLYPQLNRSMIEVLTKGLPPSAVKIFEFVAAHESVDILEITEGTGLARRSIYYSLEKLINEKNLLGKIIDPKDEKKVRIVIKDDIRRRVIAA